MLEQPNTWKPMAAVVDLRGLADADGITSHAKETVGMLVDEYGRHSAHNEMLRRYYDGDVQVSDYGVTADIPNDQACDWPEKAVSAWAERIALQRIVTADDDAVRLVQAVVERSNLVDSYNQHVPVKGLYGCMAATVNRGRGGHAVVRFHGADTFTALPSPDYTDGAVASGLAIARSEYTPWSRHTMVPTVVNLHEPYGIGEFRQVDAGRWVYSEGPTPERIPTLFVFAHRRVGTVAPFGRTRITKFVRTLTDDAIRCLWHMQVSGAFYSMAKLYMIGLTDEQFDSVMENKTGYQLSRILALTTDGDSPHNAQVGQLSGNSPQPFIDELRCLAAQFSGATGVPLNSLGIVQDNPSSADAIDAAREDICLIAERDIRADKATLRRVVRAALAVETNVSTDELEDALFDVEPDFASPNLHSIGAKADWATKVESMVPGFGATKVGLEMVGLTDAQIERVRGELSQQQGMRLATATMEARAAMENGRREVNQQ